MPGWAGAEPLYPAACVCGRYCAPCTEKSSQFLTTTGKKNPHQKTLITFITARQMEQLTDWVASEFW